MAAVRHRLRREALGVVEVHPDHIDIAIARIGERGVHPVIADVGGPFEFEAVGFLAEDVDDLAEARCCTTGLSKSGQAKVGSVAMLQNDKELWYMIDGSFITNLPDTWALNQRFIMLALNGWNKQYKRCQLGGLTCDSQDYYNAEKHIYQVFLPGRKPADTQPLYVGFFHTGAYQESLSGYGGIKHCLIPAPKLVILDRDEEGNLTDRVFAEKQDSASMMRILGYQ